jgi:hypothetical protein
MFNSSGKSSVLVRLAAGPVNLLWLHHVSFSSGRACRATFATKCDALRKAELDRPHEDVLAASALWV